jgi:hypothetical protein
MAATLSGVKMGAENENHSLEVLKKLFKVDFDISTDVEYGFELRPYRVEIRFRHVDQSIPRPE